MEKEYMKEAYGYLYEIETSLHYIINDVMQEAYGIDWFIQAPLSMKYRQYRKSLSSFYYHELISCFRKYPCLASVFPPTFIAQLQSTIPIRNKIAHCTLINMKEFELLKDTCETVKEGYFRNEGCVVVR